MEDAILTFEEKMEAIWLGQIDSAKIGVSSPNR